MLKLFKLSPIYKSVVPFPIAIDVQALEILRRQIVMRKEQKATAAFTNKSVSPFPFKEWFWKNLISQKKTLPLTPCKYELRVNHGRVSHKINFFAAFWDLPALFHTASHCIGKQGKTVGSTIAMQWNTNWSKQNMLWNQYFVLLFNCSTGQSGLHRLCTAWLDDAAAEVGYYIY